MNKNNENISKYLDYYCTSDNRFDFAVLLNGKWGCGKTRFVEKYIESSHADIFYLSLNGVAKVSEVKKEIFKLANPILGSKSAQLVGSVLKVAGNATLRVDFNGDNKDDATVNISSKDISILDYFKLPAGSIVVFDDLERCIVSPSEMLGFINGLIEHGSVKVVTIANEEEITIRNGEQAPYGLIKEKVIGKTFHVESDIEEATGSFIDSFDEPFRSSLEKDIETIIELYTKGGYSNLRHIKYFLSDYKLLWDSLGEKYTERTELMSELFSHYLVFSIEARANELTVEILEELKRYGIRAMTESGRKPTNQDEPDERKIKAKALLKKYEWISPHTMSLSMPTWTRIVFDNNINKKEIEEELLSSIYFYDENTPMWMRFWFNRGMTDAQFTEVEACVWNSLLDGEIKVIGELLHVYGVYLYLIESEIVLRPKSELDKAIIAAAKFGDDSSLWQVQVPLKEIGNSWEHKGFQESESSHFQSMIQELDLLRVDVAKTELKKEAASIINGLVSNNKDVCKTLRQQETPVLAVMDSQNFFSAFIQLPSASDRADISNALKARYKNQWRRKELEAERGFLNEIIDLLNVELKSRDGDSPKSLSSHYLTFDLNCWKEIDGSW